jgi:16S rRNA (guanine527-N7)-methyltransferase
MDLLESRGKKARFLEQTVKALHLEQVRVIHDRAESIGRNPDYRSVYDQALVRALAPLRVILELALPLIKVRGRVLAMKGKKADQEIEEARSALMELHAAVRAVHTVASEPAGEALVVEIIKEKPTPDRFPRKPGIPGKRPL